MNIPTYNKILLPQDGSKLSLTALPHAASLANAFKSEIILLEVIETEAQVISRLMPSPTIPDGEGMADAATGIVKQEESNAQQSLKKTADQLKSMGNKVRAEIIAGIAGLEIVKFANDNEIDLIIMSTHGRSGIGRALLGSVADDVMRHAKCPVLLVHPL